MTTAPHIGILGAGAVGCYLGGRLAAAGTKVTLVGRAPLAAELQTHGLTLVTQDGQSRHLPLSSDLRYETDAGALEGCDVVLVTVKCRDTESAGELLARSLANTSPLIVSFQNGLHNA